MSATPRILVVDDNPSLGEMIQEVLLSADLQAEYLADSCEAAARLRRDKFDGVFLDLHMPSPDGIELAQQMRNSGVNRTTPIIIITGEEDYGLMARAFQAGAGFFLHKPVSRSRLLQLVRVIQSSIESERRRSRRIKARCKVSFESGQKQLSGRTLDLSLDGMLVHAATALPVGSLLQVSVELSPGVAPMRAAARVVRLVGDDCMGLHFESLGTGEGEKLHKFLLPLIAAIDKG